MKLLIKTNVLKAKAALAAALTASGSSTKTAAEIADLELDVAEAESNLAIVNSVAKSVGTYSGDGIYSNAGVDFTMTGATDNGILILSFSKYRRWHGN